MKHKKILIIISIIILLTATFFLARPYRLNLAQKYTQSGENLINKQEFHQAALEFRKAGILSPANADISYKTAQAYQFDQNFKAANSYYKKAIKINPQNKDYYLSFAKCWEQQNNFNEAIFTLRQGLDKISDKNSKKDLNIFLGQIYLIQNENTKAQKAFEDSQSDYWLGIYYGFVQDYEKAQKYFSKSNEINAKIFNESCEKIIITANSATKKVIFAQILNQTENARLALPILKDVIANYPDYRDGWVFLGYSYLELKEYDLAEEALNSALDLDPINSLTYELLARVYKAKGDTDKARESEKKSNELK